MIFFYSFLSALFVSLVLIPPLMSGSRRLGLVDIPNERKLHVAEIPLCGGIAIALATLLPVLMWVNLDRSTTSFVIGATIIVLMGIRDDAKPLDYRWKFAGQIAAVVAVMSGGTVIEHLPFCGLDPATTWLTLPITVLFLLGVTNAVNLFDGLDGLAGGCVILSLSAIAVLAYDGGGGGDGLVIIALAVIGSICGFLRYNTHPATVFMGDAGSQFLGFTSAVLSILLIEDYHRALNPALPILLLGLPILDTLLVIVQRLGRGRSPFAADRNHIHHKLLALGFRQLEAVSIVYVVQGAMIAAGLTLRYASDAAVIGAFVLISALFLVPVLVLGAVGWQVHPEPEEGLFVERRNLWLRRRVWLPGALTRILRYGVCALLIGGVFVPVPLSPDFSVLALGVAGFALTANVLLRKRSIAVLRLSIYVSAAVVAHLLASWYSQNAAIGWYLFFVFSLLSVILVLSIRVTRRDLFRVMPQDLLVLFIAIVVPNLSGETHDQFNVGRIAILFVVMLYASEFLLRRDEKGAWTLQAAALLGLGAIGIRPLLV